MSCEGADANESNKLCLVGLFLTASMVQFQVMHNTVTNLWHPWSGNLEFGGGVVSHQDFLRG